MSIPLRCEECLGRFLHPLFLFLVDAAEKGESRSRICDPGEAHCFVENADRVDPVAKILEGAKDFLNLTGSDQVLSLDGFPEFLAQVGTNADTAGSKSVHPEVVQV